MFKKIKEWYKNLGKERCLNCKSIEIFQDKPLFKENKDIKRTKSEYAEPTYDKYNISNPITSRHDISIIRDYYDWVENTDIYEIKYYCRNCNHSWIKEEQKIKIKSNSIYTRI